LLYVRPLYIDMHVVVLIFDPIVPPLLLVKKAAEDGASLKRRGGAISIKGNLTSRMDASTGQSP
jgi:hypothetical protein